MFKEYSKLVREMIMVYYKTNNQKIHLSVLIRRGADYNIPLRKIKMTLFATQLDT